MCVGRADELQRPGTSRAEKGDTGDKVGKGSQTHVLLGRMSQQNWQSLSVFVMRQ